MKDTIRKINELVKPLGHSLYDVEPTLEDVLVVFTKINKYTGIYQEPKKLNVKVFYYEDNCFTWQLTKTLTEQSEETQQTIKQIFEDGK